MFRSATRGADDLPCRVTVDTDAPAVLFGVVTAAWAVLLCSGTFWGSDAVVLLGRNRNCVIVLGLKRKFYSDFPKFFDLCYSKL